MKLSSKTKRAPGVLEVARLARVSSGTVSRVLSGRPDVGPDFVARVRHAAEKLGYRPNALASGLRRLGSAVGSAGAMWPQKTLGLLVNGQGLEAFLGDAFEQRFVEGIEGALRDRGLHLIFSASHQGPGAPAIPDMVAQGRVDGLIYKGGPGVPLEFLAQLAKAVPLVSLMYRQPGLPISSVTCDNHRGMRLAMGHLAVQGHRRVGFLSVCDLHLPPHPLHRERSEAFGKLRDEMAFSVESELIQEPNRDAGRESLDDTVGRALDLWLHLDVSRRPTAVCAATDVYALALIKAATQRGLRVPDDLAITGFMNIAAGEYGAVPLTTVAIPGLAMGRASVELLESLIRHPEEPARHLMVEPQLIPRLSS